ncbi:MAG: membrane protein insertion efficiency factor YidD [Bacteroidota bacterium]
MNIFKVLSEIFILPIKLYQWLLSPILYNVFGMRCRYQPTCSHYAIGAIREWGIIRGTWIGLKRILRCHPWGGHGHDPVPKRQK